MQCFQYIYIHVYTRLKLKYVELIQNTSGRHEFGHIVIVGHLSHL